MGNVNKRLIEENEDKNAALTNLEHGLDTKWISIGIVKVAMDTLKRELRVFRIIEMRWKNG